MELMEISRNSIWLRGHFTQDKDTPKMMHYHFVNIDRFKLLLIIVLGTIGFILSDLFMDYVVTYRTSISDPEFYFPTTIFEQAILQLIFTVVFAMLGYFIVWMLLDRTEMGLFIHYQETKTMAIPLSKLEKLDKAWNTIETYYTIKFPQHGPYFKLRFVITDAGFVKLLELFKMQKKVHLKQFLETEDFFTLRNTQFKTSLIFTVKD